MHRLHLLRNKTQRLRLHTSKLSINKRCFKKKFLTNIYFRLNIAFRRRSDDDTNFSFTRVKFRRKDLRGADDDSRSDRVAAGIDQLPGTAFTSGSSLHEQESGDSRKMSATSPETQPEDDFLHSVLGWPVGFL